MPDTLPILLPTLFVGSIFTALAGSGLGIIMVIVLSFYFDIQTSIVYMVLIGFVLSAAKVLHFYKHADWQIIRWYIILGVPLSYIGGTLLYKIPTRSIEIAIAVFCMLFSVLHLLKVKFSVSPTKRNVMLLGAVNGFQGGIIGLGNLLRNPIFLSLGLKKQRFVGTAGVVSLILNFSKTTAYLPNIHWTNELLITLLLSIPPVFGGVYIGKRLHKYVSGDIFEKLLLLVILAGAVKLLIFQ